jgi:hypothetical protein
MIRLGERFVEPKLRPVMEMDDEPVTGPLRTFTFVITPELYVNSVAWCPSFALTITASLGLLAGVLAIGVRQTMLVPVIQLLVLQANEPTLTVGVESIEPKFIPFTVAEAPPEVAEL